MKNLCMHAVRPAVICVIITVVLSHYPYVEGVNILSVDKQRQIWTVTGTITVNPQEIPEELRYNRDPDGCLRWWEEHINDALEANKIPVQVLTLDLWFESISDSEDVIGFHAECKIGRARGHR